MCPELWYELDDYMTICIYCMYVYVYIYIRIKTYVHNLSHIQRKNQVSIYIYTSGYTCTSFFMCPLRLLYIYIHTHRVYICVYICINTHIHIWKEIRRCGLARRSGPGHADCSRASLAGRIVHVGPCKQCRSAANALTYKGSAGSKVLEFEYEVSLQGFCIGNHSYTASGTDVR